MSWLLLAWLPSPAEACSPAPTSDPIAYPLAGDSIPAGGVVRPEGSALYSPGLSDLDGEQWVSLEGDGLGQWSIDAAQPPGTYLLHNLGDPVTVEVTLPVTDWALPGDRPELLAVSWSTGWVSERTTPSCLELRRRQHSFEALTLWVPASADPGWGLRVSDPSTSWFSWAHLESEPREVVFEQDLEASGTLQSADRCLTLALYDPNGSEQWSEVLPCESRAEVPGCSTSRRVTSLGPGVLGVLVLLGVRRWRRAA